MRSQRRFPVFSATLWVLFLATSFTTAAAWGAGQRAASPEEQALYETLAAKRLHEFDGNAELARFLRARQAVLVDRRPGPEEEIAHFALMATGQPYKRGALASDLREADCVTLSEKCIALACTDSWEAAYKLQNRLRYHGGQGGARHLNHEPIIEWIPANAWLFDDITATLGAPIAEFDAVFDARKMLRHYRRVSGTRSHPSDDEVPGERSVRATYIPREVVPGLADRLRTGDLVFVIGRTSARPVDPVIRPRCIHQAILHHDGTGLGVLHSAPPTAGRWTLEQLLANRSILGCKFLRLKPNARQLVADEFDRLGIVLDKTPEQKDVEVRRARGEIQDPPPEPLPEDPIEIQGQQ